MLSIACWLVRWGGKNVKRELRVKDFFSGAGLISMLALLASTYLLEISYACFACFFLLTRQKFRMLALLPCFYLLETRQCFSVDRGGSCSQSHVVRFAWEVRTTN